MYDKLRSKNDTMVLGLTKKQWKNKDIEDCIFDDLDDECNLFPGTIADLSIVRILYIYTLNII